MTDRLSEEYAARTDGRLARHDDELASLWREVVQLRMILEGVCGQILALQGEQEDEPGEGEL